MKASSFEETRRMLGLKKGEFASELGISPNTVAAYENGKRPVPRYIALACAALRYSLPPVP